MRLLLPAIPLMYYQFDMILVSLTLLPTWLPTTAVVEDEGFVSGNTKRFEPACRAFFTLFLQLTRPDGNCSLIDRTR
ncbi:hypothetical protein DL93DRAFT_2069863 [Clavulina sp. PMI_390]|nr:hypothetical protein DL93DRAFT_2069863 [Clavulina sp. PMI_390]